MRFSLVAAALIFALPAAAEPEFGFRGQWQIDSPSRPNYIGVVLIDGQRRVTWDSPNDNGRPAQFVGYIRTVTPSRMEMLLTNRDIVVTIDCLIESRDLLHCHIGFANGSKSPLFALARAGTGPASLAPKR